MFTPHVKYIVEHRHSCWLIFKINSTKPDQLKKLGFFIIKIRYLLRIDS